MPTHLSLLTDGVTEFLAAFSGHKELVENPRRKERIQIAARAIRSLYLSLEKALKHAITHHEPLLLVERLDSKLLTQIARDRVARPVPTLLCVRPQFRTITAEAAWELVKAELLPNVDSAATDSFDRAFHNLCEVRHRAQHAELYMEVEEIQAALTQTLASVRPILEACCPAFLEACYRRNAQLKARLLAIELKLDAAWQVLVDYLARQSTPLSFTCHFGAYLDPDGSTRVHFNQSLGPTKAHLLLLSTVPAANATGLFAHNLTPSQAAERQASRLGPARAGGTNQLDFSQALTEWFAGNPTASTTILSPLEPGRLLLPSMGTWLSIRLPRMRPPLVLIRFLLHALTLEYEESSQQMGTLTGFMLPPVLKNFDEVTYIPITGQVGMTEETRVEPDPSREHYLPNGGTAREFDVTFQLHGPLETKRSAAAAK